MTKSFNLFYLKSAAFVAILTLTAAVKVNAQTVNCPAVTSNITVEASCNAGIDLTGNNRNLTIGTPTSGSVVVTKSANSPNQAVSVVGTGNTINNTSSGVIERTREEGAGILNNAGATIVTLTNSGTIRSSGFIGTGIVNFGTIGTLTNPGTITVGAGGYGISHDLNSINTTLTNTGTITAGVNGQGIRGNRATITDLANSGTITAGMDGIFMTNDSVVTTLTNTGTITAGVGGFGILNSGSSIPTLNNAQGGNRSSQSTTALTYRGNLPDRYNVMINSATHYGQLAVTDPLGAITDFGILGAPLITTRTYASVLSGTSAPTGIRSGTYDNMTWSLVANGAAFDLVFAGASLVATQQSIVDTANALRNAFNLQSAKIAQGLKYDCTVYDQNNICVSFAGTRSDGKDFDGTTGALIVAHQPSKQFRWGAYVDQSMGSSASGGLTIKNGKSGYGAFAVWSESTDGSGVRVRTAANVGNVDMKSTREAFETSEAGFGRSNIESSGVQLEISKGYAINSTWGARPYVGYRKTTNTRAAYAEQETDDVTAPLSYSSLKQNVETLSAGVTFAHTESAKTSMFLTAGVDHEAKNRFDRYQATSEAIGEIDAINLNDDKRKTYLAFSLAVNHDFDKTQRLGVTLNHRKQVSASGSVTSAMVQYSKGF